MEGKREFPRSIFFEVFYSVVLMNTATMQFSCRDILFEVVFFLFAEVVFLQFHVHRVIILGDHEHYFHFY